MLQLKHQTGSDLAININQISTVEELDDGVKVTMANGKELYPDVSYDQFMDKYVDEQILGRLRLLYTNSEDREFEVTLTNPGVKNYSRS